MSLLKKMGAAVGVGAAEVEVLLAETRYSWGDPVRGTLRVRSGSVEQSAADIRVSVQEHWETRDSEGDRNHHYEQYGETVLARDVVIAPGSEQEWPFELAVPEGATPHHDWSIAARISIPRAADRRKETAIQVGFPSAILTVAGALCELAEFRQVSAGVRGTEVDLDFRPPQELKKTLDGVRLILRREGEGVAGVLEINPQERSVGDFLKALAKKDRIRHDLRFSEEELAAGGSSIAPVVAQRLREHLQPFLG